MGDHIQTLPPLRLETTDVEGFLASLERKGRQRSTVAAYATKLSAFLGYASDGLVRENTLARWRESLLDQGYSAATANSYLSAANGLMSFLGRRDLQFVDLPGASHSPRPTLTRVEYLSALLRPVRGEGEGLPARQVNGDPRTVGVIHRWPHRRVARPGRGGTGAHTGIPRRGAAVLRHKEGHRRRTNLLRPRRRAPQQELHRRNAQGARVSSRHLPRKAQRRGDRVPSRGGDPPDRTRPRAPRCPYLRLPPRRGAGGCGVGRWWRLLKPSRLIRPNPSAKQSPTRANLIS